MVRGNNIPLGVEQIDSGNEHKAYMRIFNGDFHIWDGTLGKSILVVAKNGRIAFNGSNVSKAQATISAELTFKTTTQVYELQASWFGLSTIDHLSVAYYSNNSNVLNFENAYLPEIKSYKYAGSDTKWYITYKAAVQHSSKVCFLAVGNT